MKSLTLMIPLSLMLLASTSLDVQAQTASQGSTSSGASSGGTLGTSAGGNMTGSTTTDTGTDTGTSASSGTMGVGGDVTTSGTDSGAGITSSNTGSISTGTDSTSGTGTANLGMGGGGASNWDEQSSYWRENFSSRPYASGGTYESYEPAYRYGVEAFNQYGGRRFEDLNESELRANWESSRGTSNLSWDQARDAVRDAYSRMYDDTDTTSYGRN